VDSAAWDERYRVAELLWSAGPNIFVEEHLGSLEPGLGLDLASGEGRNAIWLASRGWEMTAVDFSAVALERGGQIGSAVNFVEADVFEWAPDRVFDLVLIAYLQVEAEPLSEIVRRAITWLDDGGILFMVGHDVSNIDEGVGGPRVPEILWDLDLILEWLNPLHLLEAGVVERPVEVDGDIRYARDTLVKAIRESSQLTSRGPAEGTGRQD
jgi:SAM-dependent methyltransferase